MSLIHNERTKLTATSLNGVAVAIIAVGALAPILAGNLRSIAVLAAQAAICLGAGLVLHVVARRLLGRLIP